VDSQQQQQHSEHNSNSHTSSTPSLKWQHDETSSSTSGANATTHTAMRPNMPASSNSFIASASALRMIHELSSDSSSDDDDTKYSNDSKHRASATPASGTTASSARVIKIKSCLKESSLRAHTNSILSNRANSLTTGDRRGSESSEDVDRYEVSAHIACMYYIISHNICTSSS
jgi:hypothetical protein